MGGLTFLDIASANKSFPRVGESSILTRFILKNSREMTGLAAIGPMPLHFGKHAPGKVISAIIT
jgi:uncharacterized membrane protein